MNPFTRKLKVPGVVGVAAFREPPEKSVTRLIVTGEDGGPEPGPRVTQDPKTGLWCQAVPDGRRGFVPGRPVKPQPPGPGR